MMLTITSCVTSIANFYIRPPWQPLGKIVTRLSRPRPSLLVSQIFLTLGLGLSALTNHFNHCEYTEGVGGRYRLDIGSLMVMEEYRYSKEE